ncbi:MAG: EamA family transporter [Phycisphaeraceae bacterium]|nr:EamA family transporter [Phycisphaeraceae bacterium]
MAPLRAHLNLHAAIVILSLTAILGKMIQMGVPQTISGRSLIGAAVLGVLLYVRGDALMIRNRTDRRWNSLAGILLALHWITFFQAVRTGSVATGMLGLFTFPVMLTFLEPIFYRERIRGWSILHGVLVLGGIAMVIPEWSLSNTETAGMAWGLLSAVLYACRDLMTRRLIMAHGSIRVMFGQVLVSGVMLAPAWFWSSGVQWPIDWVWLLVLGAICTAIGHTMFIASFRHFRVATASIILTLEPVYAVLLAIPVFGELPRWQTWVGGVIILVAIAHESYRHALASRAVPTAPPPPRRSDDDPSPPDDPGRSPEAGNLPSAT